MTVWFSDPSKWKMSAPRYAIGALELGFAEVVVASVGDDISK